MGSIFCAAVVGLLGCSSRGASALRAPMRVAPARRATPATMTLTERLMATLPQETETGGAGGQTTYTALQRLDSALTASGMPPSCDVVPIYQSCHP